MAKKNSSEKIGGVCTNALYFFVLLVKVAVSSCRNRQLLLFVGGSIVETVAGFENWKTYEKNQYYKYFLFPDDWTAQLKTENFTEKDLINPKIIVSFSEDNNKIIIDRPTIKAGQMDYVDIPIANRLAMSITGVEKNGKINVHGNFHVELKSSNVEKIQLIRYLTVSDEE